MASNENHRDTGLGIDQADNHAVGRDSGLRFNPRSGLNPLHEAAIRLADGINKPRAKTRDLMNLLLCHGARAWRYSQPEANIHLHVNPQYRRLPVKLRLR
ncbi:hypothetical protein [Allorhizobium taibaishanense]|uniref:Uncharacterized protein n=1 Tax=Allorhizobium taibaishanense TaxID=887144 RepID=A0A1Q9A162_9HYPH|nr:hypothetical protein [Allorhizobium taibaishanense]MBB4008010.1 hypothetical protein [Allorhizobium taibaishanense]OLP48320.1 hypothetical protein BJF91_09345 [Allorhizobium taibaishanense]